MTDNLFSGEGEFPIERIAQSEAIYMNDVNITSAKLIADVAIQDTDQIIFYMAVSATESGTYTFEQVTNNVSHVFSATGKWIKWKARFLGYAGNSTYFENLRIQIE